MDYSHGAYDPETYDQASAQGAAIYVGVMIALSAVFLAVMKKSGFRAMVAVGRS
jgi:hypothetical protein